MICFKNTREKLEMKKNPFLFLYPVVLVEDNKNFHFSVLRTTKSFKMIKVRRRSMCTKPMG